MFQYRITLNGNKYEILDYCPTEQWGKIAEVSDNRRLKARLERRLITDDSILPMLEDTKGYIKLKDGRVVCPFEVIAEIESN